MLSVIDLKKELGENIYLYPLHPESFKSNSIDLHASQFAWSITKKCSIVNNGYIEIEAGDTALIYSEESLYVTNRIGGSYHSKVTLVSQGTSHIGTTLDAQYIGCSLIAVSNNSKDTIKIKVGHEFVTIQFWYLNTPDYDNVPSHDNDPGHPRMLNGFQDVDKYMEWRDSNTWTTRKKDLIMQMKDSDQYTKLKADFEKEMDRFSRNKIKKKTAQYLKIIVIMIIAIVLLCIPSYIFDFGTVTILFKNISERIAFPVILSITTAFIIADYKNYKNANK